MTHVFVCVRFYGTTVESRLIPVDTAIRLGDSDDAAVNFPGTSFLVERRGKALYVRGYELAAGQGLRLGLGAVEVELHSVHPTPPKPVRTTLDPRLTVAFVALLALAGFSDAVHSFVRTNPVVRATFPAHEPLEQVARPLEFPHLAPMQASEIVEPESFPHYPSAVYLEATPRLASPGMPEDSVE